MRACLFGRRLIFVGAASAAKGGRWPPVTRQVIDSSVSGVQYNAGVQGLSARFAPCAGAFTPIRLVQ